MKEGAPFFYFGLNRRAARRPPTVVHFGERDKRNCSTLARELWGRWKEKNDHKQFTTFLSKIYVYYYETVIPIIISTKQMSQKIIF